MIMLPILYCEVMESGLDYDAMSLMNYMDRGFRPVG